MNKKKKVLLVTFSDNADHQEVIYSLFEELIGKLDVWVMGIQNPKVPHLDSIRVYYVDAPRRPGITSGTFNIPELLRILGFIRKQKFDLIYFETLHTWNIPIWSLSPKKTRIVQAMHDVEPHSGDGAVKSVEIMNKAAVKLVNTILLRNKQFIPILANKYGVDSSRIIALDPWRRFPEYNPPVHSHKALFFGRLNEYKGIAYLPQIIKLCPDVQFEIVGRADSTVEQYIDELKTMPNVHLASGYVSDEKMVSYFREADFVILPYKSASQSGVVLDANKFGRPPIAFSVGAIGDQIVQGVNGILINEGDVEAFARQVNRMATIPAEQLDEFSRKSYEYAFKRFSSVFCAAKFLKMVEEVTGNR